MSVFWITAVLMAIAAAAWLAWRKAGDPNRLRGPRMLAFVLVPVVAGTVYWLVGTPNPDAGSPMAPTGAHAGEMGKLAEGLAAKLKANPNDVDGWRLLASTYKYLGDAEAARAAQARVDALEGGHDVNAAIAELEGRLKANPDDAEGWVLLGRSYQSQRRFVDAAGAFGHATELQPKVAAWWADRADALAAAKDRRLEPVSEWIDTALQLDPNEPKALWLAGTLELERGDKAKALERWRHLEKVLPPGDPRRAVIRNNIAELDPHVADVPDSAVSGIVELAPGLKDKLGAGATLFVFARAPSGPPMPIAVWRGGADGFPLRFRLDAGNTLSPNRPLNAFDSLAVGARISRSGNAVAAPGDLESPVITVKSGEGEDLRLVIDHAVN